MLVTCHYCLGEKLIFNGKDWHECPMCRGDGIADERDLEEWIPDRIFPDDRVPFDEDTFYSDEG